VKTIQQLQQSRSLFIKEIGLSSAKPPLMSTRAKPHQGGPLGLVMRYEFGRFLIVGAIAALGNLLSAWSYRILFDRAPFYFEASVALGFSVGTVASFLLNKSFTFQMNDGKTWGQALRFLLISMVSVAISTIVAHVILTSCMALPKIAGNIRHVELSAHILTIGVMAIFNYFALKLIVFRKPRV